MQSCSFGVRVKAVIATLEKRSAVRCLGKARANWSRMASELISVFRSLLMVVSGIVFARVVAQSIML